MKKPTIPGTFRLEHIRSVVRETSKGADSSASVSKRTGISTRHVSFAVRSALLLGWLEGDQKSWHVTVEGQELLETSPGSLAESLVFRRAISASAGVKHLSPDLLKPKSPTLEKLTKRIMKLSGLAEASATRGARVLLSWRRQALEQDAPDKAPVKKSSKGPVLQEAGNIRLVSLLLEGLGPFKHAQADFKPLTLLVGGAGAGKSTLVDSVTLIGEALHIGLPRALEKRSKQLVELLHNGRGDAFGLALELWLPEQVRPEPALCRARYELVIGKLSPPQVGVRWEALFFKPDGALTKGVQTTPDRVPKSWKQILVRESDDAVRYRAEGDDWVLTYVLDGSRLGLAAVPEDSARFPATLALRQYLRRGTDRLSLHPSLMREPCSPLASPFLKRDGTNLAAVVRHIRNANPRDFEGWLEAVRKALPEVRGIRVVERQDDRHLILTLDTQQGISLPVHRLSDGTLRFLALSILPYGGDPRALVLADEPAPALTPSFIAAVYKIWATSAENGRGPQLVVLTHSPLWARRAKPEQMICLDRGKKGETLIVSGAKHTRLKRWRQKLKSETLFERFPLG